MEKRKSRTVAFDFDGVITKYHGNFIDDAHIDPPNEEVIELMRILKKRGHKVIIYSTRSNETLRKYCKEHDIPVDYYNENPEFKVGNSGKPRATVYIDDRSICYEKQNPAVLLEQIENFEPYYKRDS